MAFRALPPRIVGPSSGPASSVAVPRQVGALTVRCSQVQGVNPQSSYKHSSGQATFTIDPVRDLLIWAIVQNRRELAEIIWAQVSRLQLSVDQ